MGSSHANATTGTGLTLTVRNESGSDIAAGRAVTTDSTQAGGVLSVKVTATTGGTCYGITTKTIKDKSVGEIVVYGTATAVSGAAFSAGATLVSMSGGTVGTVAASGDYVVGVALEAASGAAEEVRCFVLTPTGGQVA